MPAGEFNEPRENEDEELMEKHIPLYQILPLPIRRRIKALKKLQFQTMQLEAKFFCDVHRLESRYSKMFSQLFKKRETIINGAVEPNDEECSFNEGYDTPDEEDPLIKELRSKLTITKLVEDGARGIPEFWLTVFKNIDILNDMVQPHDEPILRHLSDITLTLHEEDPMGFTLHFHFTQNPYFSNTVLTKEYELKCAPDTSSPWSFEGPEIIKAKGCTINWYNGMNVTVKTVQKRKHKGGGAVRTVINSVQNASFFNFFSPPTIQEGQEASGETEEILETDYEIGNFIREKIVPHAVLYYTGEAVELETDEESEDEDEEGEAHENESDEPAKSESEAEEESEGDQ